MDIGRLIETIKILKAIIKELIKTHPNSDKLKAKVTWQTSDSENSEDETEGISSNSMTEENRETKYSRMTHNLGIQ